MTSLEDLQDDIAEHREELAATVDALAAKLDVRARLRARASGQAAALRRHAVPVASGLVALVTVLVVVRRRRRS